MDTRGYMDLDYTLGHLVRDLYDQLKFYRSKLVMVIKEERLYRETLQMLKYASAVSGGQFPVVISACSGQPAIDEFRGVMKERGVKHGPVVCFNKYTDPHPEKKKKSFA